MPVSTAVAYIGLMMNQKSDREPWHKAYHREIARTAKQRQHTEQVVPDKKTKYTRKQKHKNQGGNSDE